MKMKVICILTMYNQQNIYLHLIYRHYIVYSVNDN